jgi:Mn-dependent DtxR family transcriptional regulator
LTGFLHFFAVPTQERTDRHGYVSHKELAERYNVSRKTLKKELQRIQELHLRRMQRYYSPADLEIIYKRLGKPVTD